MDNTSPSGTAFNGAVTLPQTMSSDIEDRRNPTLQDVALKYIYHQLPSIGEVWGSIKDHPWIQFMGPVAAPPVPNAPHAPFNNVTGYDGKK